MADVKKVDPKAFNRKTEITRRLRTGGVDYWKPAVGKAGSPVRNIIRIMPMHKDMEDVFTLSLMHFRLGPKEDKFARCTGRAIEENETLKVIENDDCPPCIRQKELFSDAKKETDPQVAEKIKTRAKDIGVKFQFVSQIVDMMKPEAGVQLYSFGPDVNRDLRACFYDDDGEFRDISDITEGRDVIMLVDKKAGSDYNQYNIKPKENPSPLKDPKWVDNVIDLDKEKGGRGTVAEGQAAMEGREIARQFTPLAQTSTTSKGRPLSAPATSAPKQDATASVGKKLARKAIADPQNAGDPWKFARELAAKVKDFTPVEITEEEAKNFQGAPDCYAPGFIAAGDEYFRNDEIADPNDANCRKCRLFLPCASAKLAAL